VFSGQKNRLASANPFFFLEFLHKQLKRGLKIFAVTAIKIFQTARIVDKVPMAENSRYCFFYVNVMFITCFFLLKWAFLRTT